MTKRVTQAKSDPTMLLVLAAIGLVGLFVTQRYRPRACAKNGESGARDRSRRADDSVRRHGPPAGGPRAESGPRCWPFQSPALERIAQVNMARIPRPPNEAPREPPPEFEADADATNAAHAAASRTAPGSFAFGAPALNPRTLALKGQATLAQEEMLCVDDRFGRDHSPC